MHFIDILKHHCIKCDKPLQRLNTISKFPSWLKHFSIFKNHYAVERKQQPSKVLDLNKIPDYCTVMVHTSSRKLKLTLFVSLGKYSKLQLPSCFSSNPLWKDIQGMNDREEVRMMYWPGLNLGSHASVNSSCVFNHHFCLEKSRYCPFPLRSVVVLHI